MTDPKLKLLVSSLAVTLVCASGAAGQACLGLPSFAGGSVHLNAAGEFPDSAKAWALGIGAGRPNNLFANLGGGQVTFDGLDEKSSFGFLEFGVQIPVGRAQVCPIAGGTFGAGPDDALAGLKLTSRSASAGLALGVPVEAGSLRLVPNFAVKYEYLSVKVDEVDFEPTTDTFTSGIVDLGLGFVLNDRVSLQPLLHFPFGGDEDEAASFGLFASFSFGWRAR